MFITDTLIIGSGAAGLTSALQLADAGKKVTVLCKKSLQEGSSTYAQGGIAAVQSTHDTEASHIDDTLAAGAGLCDEQAVQFTVKHAKAAIEWLIDQGVRFTLDPNAPKSWPYHLTQEGGHSTRRIIHSDDATGKSVQEALSQRALNHPNIQCLERYIAIDLILDTQKKCIGAYAYNERNDNVETFCTPATILATGGASRVYLYSTNPVVSSGDGIAMAFRAGAKVSNMEFNQFHPTCLYHPQAGSFLITEAMRGEGAYLRLPNGERFMKKFDERLELAPRDIVARAIDYEMKRLGLDHVYLDITHKSPDFIKSHFPTIYERCITFGIDITTDPIPVVPAAHYTCGGVMINNYGQSNIEGLYVIGEASFTGLHGANRMASNSLLECFVYAMSASRHILRSSRNTEITAPPPWDETGITLSEEAIIIKQSWDELRRFMWHHVGIVRSDKRLAMAARRLALLREEIDDYYHRYRVNRDLLELRNLIDVASLIVECAQQRKESRGLHYTTDYPDTLEKAVNTTVFIINEKNTCKING